MTTLYRKWRPQTFAEVRGQERVIRTLQNALATGRIGHAYLFCGPRGVGKTTTARLLAKALNCLHDQGASEQPGVGSAVLPDLYQPGEAIPPEPDNTCWVCREITAGTSYDIMEIDAASTGRVDDVRDLRDRVASVGTSRYKFYILDEAHQMTKDAFDALLKTLEEPPPRVIFVLATTDAAKLPPTVLSRCQRFDFRRISVADIRANLSDISAAEGIEAEPAALEVLARAADGSSRDSQSLLDQAIAFCGQTITVAGVRAMLGMASAETIERLGAALLDGDPRAGLELINQATDAGVDPRGLNRELVEYLRSLLLLKVSAEAAATLDVAPENLPALQERAAAVSTPVLVQQIKLFSEADYGFRSALQAQLPLELAFLQALDVAGSAGSAAPRMAQAPAAPEPPAKPQPRDAARLPAPGRTQLGLSDRPAGPRVDAPAGAPVAADAAAGSSRAAETKAEWRPPTVDVPAPESGPAPALAEDGSALRAIADNWQSVLQIVRVESKNVEALLRGCMASALDDDTVILQCDGEFHVRELHKPENKRLVEGALSQVAGRPWYVKCVVRDKKADAKPPSGGPQSSKPDENDPLVRAALRMLNARVLESNG